MNNKFIAMIILKPDIKEKRINNVQSHILNMFEQSTKVSKVWYLGKQKLDFKTKKYTEGIYLKLHLTAKQNKIEQIRKDLRKSQDVLSSIIMQNDTERHSNKLLKINKLPFHKATSINDLSINNKGKKIYMLISKNLKLPFAESDIVAISDDENKIFLYASKKIQELIYAKGFHTFKHFIGINEVEKGLKKYKKVQFSLGNSLVGQELIIQEKYLI